MRIGDARAGAARRLHHGVVDAVGGDRGERLGVEAQERGVGRRGARRRPRSPRAMSGRKRPQRGEPDARAQHEHAAVPVVAAVGEVALGGRQVGLLDEGGDRRRRRRAASPCRRGCSRSRCRVGRAGCRGRRCRRAAAARTACAQRRRERRPARRSRDRPGVTTRIGSPPRRSSRRLERGERQRRRGVATERLEQHARRLDADLAQLVDDREAMLLVGDDARRAHVEAGRRRASAGAAPPAGTASRPCRRRRARGTASDAASG